MNKENFCWLCIEPYVQITFRKNRVLFYNTLNNKILIYDDVSSRLRVSRSLSKQANGYVIKLTQKELKSPGIRSFVRDLRKNFMGDLIESSWSDVKPVNILPYPVIREPKPGTPFKMEEVLFEATLHLSYCNTGICKKYQAAYNQFVFPVFKYVKTKKLNWDFVKQILSETGSHNNLTLNILGAGIQDYLKFNELCSLLGIRDHRKRYYFFPDFELKEWKSNWKNTIFIFLLTPPFNPSAIQQIQKDILHLNEQIAVEWDFIVQDPQELEEAGKVALELGLKDFFYRPFYNGLNKTFFLEYIFITEEDILQSHPDQRQIFARKLINETSNGKLTILPDGSVYANVNEPWLGNIGNSSLQEMVKNELKHGNSWNRVRSSVTPCKQCLYQLLCPPISNYELVLKKFNLCHIIK